MRGMPGLFGHAFDEIVRTMTVAIIAFLCACFAYLAFDVLASRFAGETSMSLPAGCVVVGLLCAVAASVVGTWAAVAVFVLVAGVRAREALRDRRSASARRSARSSGDDSTN